MATVTTAADGFYLFGEVAAGKYRVEFVAPAGRSFTQRNAGSDDTIDSDASSSSNTAGLSAAFTLTEGGENLTVDAGLLPEDGGGDVGEWVA